MQKEPLLFLCHRIPYPPNKGDKIRSFNILKALSERFEIFLGSFVDDPYDWQYADCLDQYCVQKLLLKQSKLFSKIKGLQAFVRGQAISLPYYYDRKMAAWVERTIKQKQVSKVFVYSSAMAQYVNEYCNLLKVVDFVDVDSDKWRQYAQGKSGLASWIYQREYRTLQKFEIETARLAHHCLFVSPQEADLFKGLMDGQAQTRVSGMLNGVDTVFFDPQAEIPTIDADRVDVVFTGAMDYWANVDAVVWFAEKVWPGVRAKKPDANFYIVGGNPTSEIKSLDGKQGIRVTGRVEDVRPYIYQSSVAVAPLQIARGIQNKVLEAMSLAKPVVATSMAIEGIEAQTQHVHVTDSAAQFCRCVLNALTTPAQAPENRQWILDNLQWGATLAELPSLFKEAV